MNFDITMLCSAEEKVYGMKIAKLIWFIRCSIMGKEKRLDQYFGSKGHRHDLMWMYDTLDALSSKLEISRRALCNYIKVLEDDGYIIIDRFCNSQGIKQHFYRINPFKDLFLKNQKTACKVQGMHYPSSILKIISNPIENPPLKSDSYIVKNAIEGDDERLISISYFEEKFKSKVTISDKKRFLKNLEENPHLTPKDLCDIIDELDSEELTRSSTISLNRVFYIDSIREMVRKAKVELFLITEGPKSKRHGQYNLQAWQIAVLSSNFARKHNFERPDMILNLASMHLFNRPWNELSSAVKDAERDQSEEIDTSEDDFMAIQASFDREAGRA